MKEILNQIPIYFKCNFFLDLVTFISILWLLFHKIFVFLIRSIAVCYSFKIWTSGTDSSYHFNELQIYGKAQLAVLTSPLNSAASLVFDNMIGDRSGALHIGNNQTMDLYRQKIDLPFSVHVYNGGFLGLAPDTFIHNVEIFLNGTLANVDNLTIHRGGKLWLNRDGHTEGLDYSTYWFKFVHVKTNGYLHMISDPVREPNISFSVTKLTIDGGGLVRGTYMYIHALNISIDAGGILSADGLGYEVSDGPPKDVFGYPNRGLHGIINEGRGYTGTTSGSGAGHGGSGGRGDGELDIDSGLNWFILSTSSLSL